MHEHRQDQPVLILSLGPAWHRRAFIYCALFSLFLTAIPVRSFKIDFSGHHRVDVNRDSQKRLAQATDASRYTAPPKKAVPAPPPEPVAHEGRPDIPLFVVHFDRYLYNRPPPVA